MDILAINNDPNLAVPWYLMAAYTYYQLDQSLITDQEFDNLAKLILKNYDTIEHRHKRLITKEELEAGTLLLAADSYPEITVDTANYLLTIKQEQKTTGPAKKARKKKAN